MIIMEKTAGMYIQIDSAVKSDVEAIYSRYGMSLTDAINVFLHTSRHVGGLPFDLREPAPGAEASGAAGEGGQISGSGKSRFDDIDSMLRELKG